MSADAEPTKSDMSGTARATEDWIYEHGAIPRLGRLQEDSNRFRVEFDDGEVVEGNEFPRRWTRVRPNSFYFRKVREPNAIRSQFEDDPTSVVVLALEALSPVAADKQRLEETLTAGSLIESETFDRQWKKAQSKLKKHPHVVTEGRPLSYRYVAEPQAAVEPNEDLIRELAQKSVAEDRRAVILEALDRRALSAVETAWLQAVRRDPSIRWRSLRGQSVPQEAATALREDAVRMAASGDLDAAGFVADQATNPRMKAVGEDYAKSLAALPGATADGALAHLVDEWSARLGQRNEGALKRLDTRLQRLVEMKATGPKLVGALLRLLAQLSDDTSADARRVVQRVTRVLSPVQGENIEHGARFAAATAGAERVAMGVRGLKLAGGSVRESVLRGLADGARVGELAEPRIWNGVADSEILRLLDDPVLAPVLSTPPLRERLTVPSVGRYVESTPLSVLLSLLSPGPALRDCLPMERLLDRISALAQQDDHVVTALDAVAGARWRKLVERLEVDGQRLREESDAAGAALEDIKREADALRRRVGELQAEVERVRRTSGAQARFDALRGLGEAVAALAVWSTHPDRLGPDEVFDHALQRARAHGLELVGEPGSQVDFDESLHRLLVGDPTARVTVVEPGVVLREAGSVTTLIHAKVQRIEE